MTLDGDTERSAGTAGIARRSGAWLKDGAHEQRKAGSLLREGIAAFAALVALAKREYSYAHINPIMRIGCIILCCSVFCSVWLPEAKAQGHCSIKDVTLASCTPKARHFRSVMIAIPGWNGSCQSTFGEGNGNLLNVMRHRALFFDIDCFDYDSHHDTLEQSRGLLRERIEALHNAGYREFAFVTHSTGGVLALDFLLSEAMNAGGTTVRVGDSRSFIFRSDRGLRFQALYTWAVPLNGIRQTIEGAGGLINLLKISPAVLPLIAADSDYLKKLKQRLRAFDAAIPSADWADRSNYQFSWFIFQGHKDDWVVRNIDPAEPWFPAAAEIKPQLVLTASSHSHNVAAAGEVGAPLYPGEIMSDKVLLALRLLPRIEEYFTLNSRPTDELARQQRTILKGILGFADNRNLFVNAYPAVSQFVVLLLNGKFRRDPKFDDEAVSGLESLLQRRVDSGEPESVIDFGDHLLNDVERGFTADAVGSPDGFGGGSRVAVRRLVDVLDYVFKRTREILRTTPDLAVHLRSSGGSIETFERRAAAVLPRFLAVADDETRMRTIRAMQTIAANATVPALVGSGMIDQLADYTKQRHRDLPENTKRQLAEVFNTLIQRSDAVSSPTLGVLSEDVPWIRGQQRPLWFTILDKGQVELFVQNVVPETLASKGQVQFLGSVIANGGGGGNSPQTAERAVDAYQKYLAGANAIVAAEDAAILREAGRKSSYPAIARSAERALVSAGH